MAITRVYLTEEGADLLAKAQIGSEIAFTRAEVGEGLPPAGTVITQMTSLVQPVKEIYPSKVTGRDGQATIQLNFTNEGVGRPFFWYEVGVYATDPDVGEILYAYGNAMEAEHADEIPAVLTEFLFNVILKVQNAENVTVSVDKSLIYSTQTELNTAVMAITGEASPDGAPAATLKEAKAHMDGRANPHGVTKAQVGLGNVNNTADTNKPVSTAQRAAIDAVQTALDSHAEDAVKHITAAERTKWDTVDGKVDKVTGKGLSANDYTTAEKNKLAGIAEGANSYVHPASHPASIITQDATHRFVSDAEKSGWNGKGDMLKSVYDANGDGVVDNAAKVNGLTVETAVPANAKFTDTVYTHPTNHPASMITGLATVAKSGKYTDLSGTPSSLPANGGTSAACSGNAATATTATNSNACNGLTFAVSQTVPGVVNNRVTFVWG